MPTNTDMLVHRGRPEVVGACQKLMTHMLARSLQRTRRLNWSDRRAELQSDLEVSTLVKEATEAGCARPTTLRSQRFGHNTGPSLEAAPASRRALRGRLVQTARKLGVALLIVEATTPEELDAAFASAAAQHADSIVDVGDTLTVQQTPRVTALAAKH